MSSKFIRALEKQAGVAGAVVGGLGYLGKKMIQLGGGKINTALTGLGAVGDYQNVTDKFKKARTGQL